MLRARVVPLVLALAALMAPLRAQPAPPQALLGWQSFFDCLQYLVQTAGHGVPEWVVHSVPITYPARQPRYDERGSPLLDAAGQPLYRQVTQSGRVFFPPSWRVPFNPVLPLVVYTHASVLMKQAVPSAFGGYEWFVGAAAATYYGMAVAMPDQPGLGVDSGNAHPFCHNRALALSTVDSLPCARDLFQSDPYLVRHGYRWDGSLYVLGYSEGGYTALATVKELETHAADYAAQGFRLTGSACMAGPFDLSGTTRNDLLFKTERFAHPFFISYVVNGYHSLYGALADPRDIFTQRLLEPREDGELLKWMDGTLEGPVVDARITARMGEPPLTGIVLRELFNPVWRVAALEDPAYASSDLHRLLADNDAWRGWVPTRPILFAHCPDDVDVPVEHTLVAVDHLAAQTRAAGGDPQPLLITRLLGQKGDGQGHVQGVLKGLGMAFRWIHEGMASPALLPATGAIPEPPPGLERGWPEGPVMAPPTPRPDSRR